MPVIKQVTDNNDKAQTYKAMMGRHSRAMRNGFYIEAMMIDYAMMEDRLSSFLYYIGLLDDKNARNATSNQSIKKPIRELYNTYKNQNSGNKIMLDRIWGKVAVIKATLRWYIKLEKEPDNQYLKLLKKKYDGLDVEGLLEILEEVGPWCKYRNDVMHAVMNVNIDHLYEDIAQKAEVGKDYGRFIDNQVSELKKAKNNIRKAMKL